MAMSWCSNCEECPICRDPGDGYVCCTLCGRVLDQEMPCMDNSGQSRLTGNIIKIMQHEFSAPYERTLKKGRDEISDIVDYMNISGGVTIINKAHAFYEMAVDKNFTKGRKISHVAAACLYLACRQSRRDYLLIDFLDYLEINVYELGAVFLQLCKTLNLLEHLIVQKIVDPSLFIHRFTKRLLGKKNDAVSEMALRLVASMKRDWMQTGRIPSGLCGAALYISVHSHGLNYSKSDIVSAVHICEATLNRQLIEFENNEFNEESCDVNMTPYVDHTEGKASKEPGSADSAGHESIGPSTFSEQTGFADSTDDSSDHFSFSVIDDAGERKQRLAEEVKNMTPAQTPLEATCQMLKRKIFSSKISSEVLETLFISEQDSAKKQKVESDDGDPYETPNKKDDHADDPDNKDGDGLGASENDNYDTSYDDYMGDIDDEDFDYGDEDDDYGDEDYGDEDYGYEYGF